MEWSKYILFDNFTIGAITPVLFIGVLAYYFLSIKSKSQSTFHISAYLSYSFFFFLAYVFSAGIYHPMAAYHRWVTIATCLVQIAHYSYMIFCFPENKNPKIGKAFLYFWYGITGILAMLFFYESLSAQKIYLFEGHYWDFKADVVTRIYALSILVAQFSILGMGVFKFRQNQGSDSWTALLLGVFGFTLFLIPGVTNLLSRNGIIDRGTYQLTQNLSTILGVFVTSMIYFNSTKDRSTFLSKILLVTLATVLLMVQGFSYFSLQDQEKAFDTLLQARAELSVHSGKLSDEAEYMVVYESGVGVSPIQFRDKKTVSLDFEKYKQEYEDILMKAKMSQDSVGKGLNPMTDDGERIYRKSANETEHFVSISNVDVLKGKVYEIGFPYVMYRNFVHNTSTKYLKFILLMVAVIVIGFPWFFRGSLLLPIQNILAGLKEMQSGNLRVQIPVRVEDEFGFMSYTFNLMAKDLSAMKDHLEDLVLERTLQLRQKTKDIQSMLQNMPEGILTVLQDGTIHSEYSDYLEVIFETSSIKGKNLMEFLFLNSNLDTDTLSQIQGVILSSIGVSKLTFDFNSHLLVSEFTKEMKSKKFKTIELTWSAICDETETVEKIMVCVRDVSELRRLAAEATKQRQELEMIGEILPLSAKNFYDFVDSSEQLLKESRDLILSPTIKDGFRDDQVVAILFRNMHTIKGNSRTFGLRHLTNLVHDAESMFSELKGLKDGKLDGRLDAKLENEKLIEKLNQIEAAIRNYVDINVTKLGRKKTEDEGSFKDFEVEHNSQIRRSLQILQTVDRSNVTALNDAIEEVSTVLKFVATQTLRETLADVIGSLASLSKELGKEPPVVIIDDRGILIKKQASALFKNVFTHIFRNAVDHGIESGDERTRIGKNPVGCIRVEASIERRSYKTGVQEGRGLCLRVRDDGRGLAVAKIREKALEMNLINASDKFTEYQIAQLIFSSGLSTAKATTQLSGRGVGMNAVESFLKDEGGFAEIHFLDSNDGAEFRTFEIVLNFTDKVTQLF